MTRIFHHVIFAWITIQAVLIGRAGCSDFHSSSTTSAAYANKGGRGPYTDFGDKYDSTQTKQIANRERSGNGGFFGDFLNEFIHQARGFIYQSLQFVGDNPWILLALLAPAIHHWVGTIGLEVVSIIASKFPSKEENNLLPRAPTNRYRVHHGCYSSLPRWI